MRKILKLNTSKTFNNITSEIESFVSESGGNGIVNIFSRHTTLALWLTEDELLHLADIDTFLEKNAPLDGDYLHDRIHLRNDVPKEERINAHSHIRHLFFNSSENIPVEDGKLLLGKWKQLFAVELDPERDRELIVTFIKY
jgi:secondary thiamine-phosphate synthase enzyme